MQSALKDKRLNRYLYLNAFASLSLMRFENLRILLGKQQSNVLYLYLHAFASLSLMRFENLRILLGKQQSNVSLLVLAKKLQCFGASR